jgi:hypothetical protein
VDRELTHQEVMDEGAKAAEKLRSLLGDLVDQLF